MRKTAIFIAVCTAACGDAVPADMPDPITGDTDIMMPPRMEDAGSADAQPDAPQEPVCDPACANGCAEVFGSDALVCRCDSDACDNGCDDFGVCRPSLRGGWQVIREVTREQGCSTVSVGDVLVVDWSCVKSGNFDWPLQCSVSGQTIYNPLAFRQDYPDASGGVTLDSGATMNVTLTLDEDGDSFTGNETVVTGDCTVQRTLSGRR